MNTHARQLHYGIGIAAATISFVRDALLVLLPMSGLADDEG